MNHPMKRAALPLCAALLITTLGACGTSGGQGSTPAPAPSDGAASSAASEAAERQAASSLDLTGATRITLDGTDVSIQGSGATAEDGVVIITAGGVYAVSGTLTEGRIVVNAPKAEVTVALDGADVACSYGSPLYIYKASAATIHLMEGTENFLADGASYTYADSFSSQADEEPNACLYSKADLVIEGAGSLTVTGNCNNGVTGKDTLQIYDCTLAVSAVNHGINGKDSNTVDGAALTVTCGGDALRSTNDTDAALGWVSVTNSTLDLTAGEDGIQAETSLALSGGSCTVTAGGGSGATLTADASAKGLKAGTTLTLNGGSYILDCADDAVHAGGDVTVLDGTYTVSSGDDGFHSDAILTVSGGTIDILTSYEGLEGSDVAISGGTIRLVTSDDGVNAAGGADGSGFGGRDKGGAFGAGTGSHTLTISGGYVAVRSGGDGLDANGSVALTGGTVLVFSTGQGDGALDCDGGLTLTGGTVLAASAGGMPQAPNSPEQYTISVSLGSALEAGTYLRLAGEAGEFVFRLPARASHLVFSSPELTAGATYTLSTGGSYTGTCADGLCSEGTYSGGTVLTELTLSNLLTTYGAAGAGGMMGRDAGGKMGGQMGGGQAGGDGETPNDWQTTPGAGKGELPEGREMPEGGEFPTDRNRQELPEGETVPNGGGRGWDRGGFPTEDDGSQEDPSGEGGVSGT